MRAILAGLCILCAANTAHAQVIIYGGDFERGLRPGYNIPSNGEPFSHRYGYSTDMSSFYFGGGPNAGWLLGYLEYLDRQDRAAKFGYQPPPYDYRYEFPEVHVQPSTAPIAEHDPAPPSHRRVGMGFGIFRRR